MERVLLIVLFCLFISCLGTSDNRKKKDVDTYTIDNIVTDSCTEKLRNLIVTSANFNNSFKDNLAVAISEVSDNIYEIKLYVHDSGENAENTVGWIQLNIEDNSLIDFTNDPDEGVLLQYNKQLYDEYLYNCIGKESKHKTVVEQKILRVCTLPFDFDKYYNMRYILSEEKKCDEIYPVYSYDAQEPIAKIIGGRYNPTEYMCLPDWNNYQIVILCNTESDIETYDMLVISKGEILSSLEIGRMGEQGILDFDISKEYLITLYKRNSTDVPRKQYESYQIDSNGKIVKCK